MADPVRIEDYRPPENDQRPNLHGGGGGSTFNPMEARVKALEEKFDRIDTKLDGLGKDLSYMRGKIESLPSTLQLLGFVLAVLAIAGLAKYFSP